MGGFVVLSLLPTIASVLLAHPCSKRLLLVHSLANGSPARVRGCFAVSHERIALGKTRGLCVAFIGFLILFPLVVAIALFAIRSDAVRNAVVWVGASATALASVVFAATALGAGSPVLIEFSSPAADYACTAVSVVIAVVIVSYAMKYRNALAFALALVQVVGTLAFEFGLAHHVEVTHALSYDSLTVLMVLIIGVIGSGICVYALGYMADFQAHEPEGARDRRPTFFALMFLFLSAMYLIVFSNNMAWMFTGWEVTTVCSFLLIGYTKTEEAIRNSFRQINMNLLGGIGFLGALALLANAGTLSFNEFLESGSTFPQLAVVPVTLLAFAGLTKAAQMPFQSWLLGAMVAPTPTSALLHSSTMVKAGVFLLVKLAPLFTVCVVPQTMVVLVGGVTFLLCSCLAISQTNAKRVLAYSTIANLGLITACAGVGTPEALWAAMFLILFHAIAKSLLFLCVGTAEHHIGSRDIESMDLLFDRMPRLARFMMIGIMCMFIAPFGMLVSKWAAIASFAEAHQFLLLIILAFGSAATFMFWAKWIGKLAGIAGNPENVEESVHPSEWAAIVLMVALLVLACVTMPLVSSGIVEPYLLSVYAGFYEPTGVTLDNLLICIVATLVVVAVLLFGLGTKPKGRRANVYLAGVSVDSDARLYQNSLSQPQEATARNWYMEDYFSEKRLGTIGTVFCAAVIVFALGLWAIALPSIFVVL